MDNLESSILDLVSSIFEFNKKREIRVGDLNSLSRKAEELKGSFTFTKRLLTELSQEGTESVEKLRSVEAELKAEKESHQQCIENYEEQIAILNTDVEKKNNEINELSKENNELLKERNSIKVKLANSEETCSLLREEMQKAQLTCTTYEEQIIRLNEQLSLETIEKQNKGDFYEKKVQDLEERVEIMEEGMYDPEAYYCLERDKCLEEANRLEEEMQSVSLTSQKKDYLLSQKVQECERLSKEIDHLRSELQDYLEVKNRAEKMEGELAELMHKVEANDHFKKEVEDTKNLLEDIATANALIADLTQANNELKNQIGEIETEREKQSQLIANQRASLEFSQGQIDRLSEKLEQSAHALDRAKEEHMASFERVQQLEKSLEEKEMEKEKEILDYQDRIHQLTEELALKDVPPYDDNTVLELEAELQKDEQLIQELEAQLRERTLDEEQEWKEQLHSVMLEKEEFQRQVVSLKDQYNDILHEKEQLHSVMLEKEELQAVKNQLTQEKDLLEEQLLEKDTLLKEASKQQAELLQRIQSNAAEMDQMKQQIRGFEERSETIQMDELHLLEERCNQLEKEIQVVSNQPKGTEHPNPINTLLLESLRNENEILNKRVLELIVARETAEKSAYSLEATVRLLTNSLALREKEIESLGRTLTDKSVLIGQLKSQLAVYNHSYVCLSKQNHTRRVSST